MAYSGTRVLIFLEINILKEGVRYTKYHHCFGVMKVFKNIMVKTTMGLGQMKYKDALMSFFFLRFFCLVEVI